MSDREETAYHEAGHVFACDELGVLHGGLSIIPRGDGTGGRVPVEGDDGFFVPEGIAPDSLDVEGAFCAWAEEQAVIDYAGHAGVVELLGIADMTDRSAARHGAGLDFEKARERLGGNADRLQSGKDLAVAIVAARARDVHRLARTELRHGYLDAQLVDCVLYESPFSWAVLREALATRRAEK